MGIFCFECLCTKVRILILPILFMVFSFSHYVHGTWDMWADREGYCLYRNAPSDIQDPTKSNDRWKLVASPSQTLASQKKSQPEPTGPILFEATSVTHIQSNERLHSSIVNGILFFVESATYDDRVHHFQKFLDLFLNPDAKAQTVPSDPKFRFYFCFVPVSTFMGPQGPLPITRLGYEVSSTYTDRDGFDSPRILGFKKNDPRSAATSNEAYSIGMKNIITTSKGDIDCNGVYLFGEPQDVLIVSTLAAVKFGLQLSRKAALALAARSDEAGEAPEAPGAVPTQKAPWEIYSATPTKTFSLYRRPGATGTPLEGVAKSFGDDVENWRLTYTNSHFDGCYLRPHAEGWGVFEAVSTHASDGILFVVQSLWNSENNFFGFRHFLELFFSSPTSKHPLLEEEDFKVYVFFSHLGEPGSMAVQFSEQLTGNSRGTEKKSTFGFAKEQPDPQGSSPDHAYKIIKWRDYPDGRSVGIHIPLGTKEDVFISSTRKKIESGLLTQAPLFPTEGKKHSGAREAAAMASGKEKAEDAASADDEISSDDEVSQSPPSTKE